MNTSEYDINVCDIVWKKTHCSLTGLVGNMSAIELLASHPCGGGFKTQLVAPSQFQSWGFTSRSTARVILGQVLRIATCGTRTHRGDSLWLDAKLANH